MGVMGVVGETVWCDSLHEVISCAAYKNIKSQQLYWSHNQIMKITALKICTCIAALRQVHPTASATAHGLDYAEGWNPIFKELLRILDGWIVMSDTLCGGVVFKRAAVEKYAAGC
jgi:hypothetical protein